MPSNASGRRLSARLGALLCVIASATEGSSALAQNSAPDKLFVKLRYDVEPTAPSCWAQREFEQAVTRAVGYEPFRDDAAIVVEVRVGGDAEHVDGRVDWTTAQGSSLGERRFSAKDADCARLLTEMSFAIGLQIDLLRPKSATEGATGPAEGKASASSSSTSKASSSPASAATLTPSDASLADRPSPPRRTEDTWQWWVGAGPSVAWGAAPSITGQGRAFLGVRQSALSLELGVAGTLPIVDRNLDGSGFRQYLLAGSAAFCGHVAALSGCLLGRAGSLKIQGLGVDRPQAPSAFIAQAGGRVGVSFPLSQLWLTQAHLDLLGLLTPRDVTLQHVKVWDMPRLSLAAGIDVAARFE
jgi:hypothetical protein